MTKYKIIFFAVWLTALSLVPFTLIQNTPLSLALKNSGTLVNFVQRALGLTAFTLMFFQIILGSFMQFWTEKLGGWIFRFHILEGVLVYTIIFFHPVMFVLFNYYLGRGFDPFFVFTGFCLLCRSNTELFYTLGRFSFWFVTTAVFAGLFRGATPFMRLHWRKFHVLNYAAFLLVGLHGFFAGTDFGSFPFIAFAVPAYLTVLFIVIFKKLPNLKIDYRSWFKSQ